MSYVESDWTGRKQPSFAQEAKPGHKSIARANPIVIYLMDAITSKAGELDIDVKPSIIETTTVKAECETSEDASRVADFVNQAIRKISNTQSNSVVRVEENRVFTDTSKLPAMQFREALKIKADSEITR